MTSNSELVVAPVSEHNLPPHTNQKHFEELLVQHLDWFAERGRQVRLWWRDDDAISSTPALETLLNFSQDFGIPLSLSVIPKYVKDTLAQRLETTSAVHVLHHGWQHKNYQDKSREEKSSEFGWRRSAQDFTEELIEANRSCKICSGRALYALCASLEPGRTASSASSPAARWLWAFSLYMDKPLSNASSTKPCRHYRMEEGQTLYWLGTRPQEIRPATVQAARELNRPHWIANPPLGSWGGLYRVSGGVLQAHRIPSSGAVAQFKRAS